MICLAKLCIISEKAHFIIHDPSGLTILFSGACAIVTELKKYCRWYTSKKNTRPLSHQKFILIFGSTLASLFLKFTLYFQVSVTPDLQKVNVFWVCKGDASDDTTNNLLSKVAGALRHELSTLRIMGEIPYIEFVKGLY